MSIIQRLFQRPGSKDEGVSKSRDATAADPFEPLAERAPAVAVEVEKPAEDDPKLRILNDAWGHRRSRTARESVDRDGEPLPWYTYPAIEYLRQLDLSSARVFEWGAGGSSLFWSSRCREVISVERNPQWYEKISAQAPDNLEVLLVENDPEYANEIANRGQFDVIAIDGESRRDCAEAALAHWTRGGLIVVDNSDWYTRAPKFLRDAGLLQVDFSGFGPINDYTWSTSLFFHGTLQFAPLGERLPMHGAGALEQFAAEDLPGGDT